MARLGVIEKLPVTTWLFEEGTFVPAAKLTANKKLSIVANYMGTPEAMYDSEGKKSWSCELNSYGKVRNFEGEYKTDCPFRYQGQYEDAETGLYYNRFRYYSPDEGIYLSQDPIGLNGGLSLYSYVQDTNNWIDVFGLNEINDLGKIGETNAGITKNTKTIPAPSGNREYRIPDAMSKNQRHITEVKNVNYQHFSSQIKDDLAHVNRGGKKGTVTLIVDNRTKLSKQLQSEIDAGRIKLKRKDLNKKLGCN